MIFVPEEGSCEIDVRHYWIIYVITECVLYDISRHDNLPVLSNVERGGYNGVSPVFIMRHYAGAQFNSGKELFARLSEEWRFGKTDSTYRLDLIVRRIDGRKYINRSTSVVAIISLDLRIPSENFQCVICYFFAVLAWGCHFMVRSRGQILFRLHGFGWIMVALVYSGLDY